MLQFTDHFIPIHQQPQVFPLRAALNPFIVNLYSCSGIILTQMQDLASGLVDLYKVCMCHPRKLVKVLLDKILSLQCTDCTTQLGVTNKLPEDALNLTVMTPTKMPNNTSLNMDPLRTLLIARFHDLDVKLLTTTL